MLVRLNRIPYHGEDGRESEWMGVSTEGAQPMRSRRRHPSVPTGSGWNADSIRDDTSRPQPLSYEGSGEGAPNSGRKGYAAMAAPVDRPGDSSSEHPSPETSERRPRDRVQLDFEIDFFGRLLERDPYFVDALRAQANNLAVKGQHARALQLDRRLVRLTPEDAIAWYNLACSYTVLGMIDPGFFALQRALELGYAHARRLLRDPDLKALRRDPRFDRLLRRFGFRT